MRFGIPRCSRNNGGGKSKGTSPRHRSVRIVSKVMKAPVTIGKTQPSFRRRSAKRADGRTGRQREIMSPRGLFCRVLASAYKHALGRMLGFGLKINDFSFPSGYSPVPTPARHYIDLFLKQYDREIHGRCVEFMPPYYRAR